MQIPPLGPGPWVFDTHEQHRLRVTIVTQGLSHPWAIAFLPDGSMLVTERPGRLRVVRNGVLDPQPDLRRADGPDGRQRRADGRGGSSTVCREPPRLSHLHEGGRATKGARRSRADVSKAARSWTCVTSSSPRPRSKAPTGERPRRFRARRQGLHVDRRQYRQHVSGPGSLRGKILRLNDDGSVPGDNPFVGSPGYRPEIYTLGHRNTLGLIVHPETGDLWNHENGPNGGDESTSSCAAATTAGRR